MNKGKICVSVCAETPSEFIEKINLAVEIGDIIELRLDYLNEGQIPPLIDYLKKFETKTTNQFLFTLRPQEQGGRRKINRKERINFWRNLTDFRLAWVDLEYDVFGISEDLTFQKKICSHHDFEGVPENLTEIVARLRERNPDFVKLVLRSNNYNDSVAIFNLLKTENSQPIIPIAMGEVGKWTRILGLAHGAPLTYASLENGNETAPGQISVNDLLEVYRVKDLDEKTEIYGILGNPVSHSLSPYLHNAAFRHSDINAVYIPFQCNELGEFLKVLVEQTTRQVDLNFKGFSLTSPHKELINNYLEFMDETASKIGAVNTVKVVNGKLHGYNTDADGFIAPLKEMFGDLEDVNVGILGAGGAARACIFALIKERAHVTVFARNYNKAKTLAEEFDIKLCELTSGKFEFPTLDIIVNTTPIGTSGKLENETPVDFESMKNLQLAYDLVYNPMDTRFLRQARDAGAATLSGFEMFVSQGAKQFEIWTGQKAPIAEMRQAALLRLNL